MNGHDCGGGWGWGWIFPAMLIGRMISDAFERPGATQPAPWPTTPAGQQPAPKAAARLAPSAAPAVICHHCASAVSQAFNFCPQCGHKLSPANCRYCGQLLRPEMRFCAQCGGPRR